MTPLHDYAHNLGVTIGYADLTHLKRVGDYCDHTKEIRIQTGMPHRKTRSILAHELGHATHHDAPSMFEHYTRKQETRADQWAAHFLINTDDYKQAEEKYGTHTAWIAQELNVLERLVKAYKRTLHRIGDTVYVKPNLGIAQQKIRA